MLRYRNTILCSLLIFFISAPALFLYAADVEVPDLETRIRNTGNTIPDTAVPELDAPDAADIPEVENTDTVDETPVETPLVDAEPVAETDTVVPVPESTQIEPVVTGKAKLGTGYPGILSAELAVSRDSGALPGFSVSFIHDTADGYGSGDLLSNSGSGYFDSKTALDARFFQNTEKVDWFVAASVNDSSAGLQELNPDYYSLARKETDCSSGIRNFTFFDPALKGTLDFDGVVFSSYAEKPGTADAVVPITGYDGYNLSPYLRVAYRSGGFEAGVFGRYGYETVSDSGEFHNGKTGIDLQYSRNGFSLAGDVSFFVDSQDGMLAPFTVSFDYKNPDFILRNIYVKGGLSADRQSSWKLAETDPFVVLDGTSIYASDWNASTGFTIVPLAALSLNAGAEYRTTAFNRGVLVVTDLANESTGMRYIIERVSRNSLATTADVSWKSSRLELSVGYSGEWLDRLYRTTLHWLNLGAIVSDSGTNRIWQVSASSSFSLDGGEMPIVSIGGSIRPAKNISVALTFDDGIPLILGETRMRNDLYAEKSGIVTVSATIDF